jgi:hypothetical protein
MAKMSIASIRRLLHFEVRQKRGHKDMKFAKKVDTRIIGLSSTILR